MTCALTTDDRKQVAGIRAVCLDIDDTILDSANAARAALVDVVGADDRWSSWQRTCDWFYARYLAGEMDLDAMVLERGREFYAELGEYPDDVELLARERRRLEALRRHWRLFDDARPCLDWLRAAGYRVAAITNATGEHQRGKLAALGLLDVFDHLAIAGELDSAKPDPAIFTAACAALGVEPTQAVHVGDRLVLDAMGARDAGMHGVWLDRSGTAHDGLPAGISVISSLNKLPELLLFDLSRPKSSAGARANW